MSNNGTGCFSKMRKLINSSDNIFLSTNRRSSQFFCVWVVDEICDFFISDLWNSWFTFRNRLAKFALFFINRLTKFAIFALADWRNLQFFIWLMTLWLIKILINVKTVSNLLFRYPLFFLSSYYSENTDISEFYKKG